MRKYFMKKKLKTAFSIAGLYYSSKWNNKTIRQFPIILDIRLKPDKSVFVFRLPHGVDPKEVQKKAFVFHSMFGENIEFSGTHTVSLTLFHEVHNGIYSYDFESWEEVTKGFSLPIIGGMDVNGRLIAYDMKENPHLLIAGETGSGKSVMLRSILTFLIQRGSRVQLHLADMKRSEFHLFRGVANSVMTEKKDVKKCVGWFHKQMELRGDLLDQHELSHIDELPDRPDYLVLCIDEFSILRNEKETLEQLQDISALGRALGVFLILSTQRPDRHIVDGLLKANLTVRFAFRHADKINSRITLGEGTKADASEIDEQDKGKFFMRFSGVKYLQSPLLTTDEAKDILKGYRSTIEIKPRETTTEDVFEQFVPLLEEETE